MSARAKDGASAATTLHARPGDTLAWDPVLTKDLAIRGSVLDDEGRPLAGWRVTLGAMEGVPLVPTVKTAADGTFALQGCVQVPYTIRVACAGNDWHDVIVERDGIEPGGEPVELRVPRGAMPTCVVAGTLAADPFGGETYAMLVGERGGRLMSKPLPPGQRFELGAVPPGTYAVLLLRLAAAGQWDDQVVAQLGKNELQAGQRLELGEVRMPALGELALTLVDAKGVPVPSANVMLQQVGAMMVGATIAIQEGRGSRALPPGAYLPAANGSVAVEHEPIVVAAGARTEVRLQVAATVHREIRWDVTAVGVPMPAVATWKRAGKPRMQTTFHFWQEHPTTGDFDMAPGDWLLELRLGTGARHEFPIVVTGDDDAPVIEIVVPR